MAKSRSGKRGYTPAQKRAMDKGYRLEKAAKELIDASLIGRRGSDVDYLKTNAGRAQLIKEVYNKLGVQGTGANGTVTPEDKKRYASKRSHLMQAMPSQIKKMYVGNDGHVYTPQESEKMRRQIVKDELAFNRQADKLLKQAKQKLDPEAYAQVQARVDEKIKSTNSAFRDLAFGKESLARTNLKTGKKHYQRYGRDNFDSYDMEASMQEKQESIESIESMVNGVVNDPIMDTQQVIAKFAREVMGLPNFDSWPSDLKAQYVYEEGAVTRAYDYSVNDLDAPEAWARAEYLDGMVSTDYIS